MSEDISLWRKLGLSLASLGFVVPMVLVAAVSAAVLTETILHLNLTLPSNLNITVLLPLKAGLAGVLAAAMLAFWGFFWSEVLASSTGSEDLPAVVRAYRRWFAWLVPALLLLFVSMGADFYLALVNEKSRGATAISFGTFGAAMLMICLFVLDFTFRLAGDMRNFLDAGEVKDSGAADAQQCKTTKEQRDAVKAAFSAAGYAGPLTVASNTTIDEYIFVLPQNGFNQITKWSELTLVLQQILGIKVSMVQESASLPMLTQFE